MTASGLRLATLVSGTPRDGLWEATVRVPRLIAPGAHDLDVHMHDRVGRQATETAVDAYTVVNAFFDQEMPVQQYLTTNTSS